jgi:RNA-directed DNA polymerase
VARVGRTIEKEEGRWQDKGFGFIHSTPRRESRPHGEGMDRRMQLAKETYTGQVGLEKHRQTSLRGIAMKAKENKTHRFENLYQLLDAPALHTAFKHLKKKAAAGIDNVTAVDYQENLVENINGTVAQLKTKQYRAKLVRRVYIDKGNGKKRPLGIPAVSDKVAQHAAAKILEAIYEPEFSPQSFGYRPNTGAQKAVKALTHELNFGKYSYIVEADISNYFGTIDHDRLIQMMELRIADKAFLNLIRKWLKAGIMEADGTIIHPVTGCPQGGVISPILANIYLHYTLDRWFEKAVKPICEGMAYFCRYADDFVCAFQYKQDAQRFYQALGSRLGKFGLSLSEEKTNLISFSRFRKAENTHFSFLGFEFRWGVTLKKKVAIQRRTAREKLRKSVAAFTEWCKENRHKRLRRLFPKLQAKLRGYYNYYGLIGNYASLNQFYEEAMKILYKWLNRRSQRLSFNYTEFAMCLKRYQVSRPRIVESSTIQLQFDF